MLCAGRLNSLFVRLTWKPLYKSCLSGFGLLAVLTACSIHTPYPLGIKGKSEIVIATSQASLSAPVSNLADISSVDADDSPEAQARVHSELEAARLNLDVYMRDWMQQRENLHTGQFNDSFVAGDDVDLSWAKAQGADIAIAVDVAGYGRVKRKWILIMAGSGLIEGVAQGVATASVTGNPWLGAGVGAEEIASESLSWLGGGWLWNKYLAPVTLEGRMWRVGDGRLVWQDVQFADSSDLLALLFGGKQPAKEEALKASLKIAEDDLFDDLGHYLDTQVFFHRKGKGQT